MLDYFHLFGLKSSEPEDFPGALGKSMRRWAVRGGALSGLKATPHSVALRGESSKAGRETKLYEGHGKEALLQNASLLCMKYEKWQELL